MAWVCIHTAWGQVGTSSDPLYGKRIGVIGDSYVRNHREPVEYTWHYKFAKSMECNISITGVMGIV